MKILLGVTGGIAAYKTPEFIRACQKRGHTLRVMLTKAATHFVTPFTLTVLTHHPVYQELFPQEPSEGVDHITLAQWCDLFMVAPATANILGKIVHGIADDFLSTYALAHRKPLLLCPAMNAHMWRHPAVQENIQRLINRGAVVLPPEEGELACGEEGEGRLPPIEDMVLWAEKVGNSAPLWKGKRVVVTAGPTWEFLDKVRLLTNPSTGLMGWEIALEAFRQGAEVDLILGPSALKVPQGITLHRVTTTDEMWEACHALAPQADLLVMAAAPADFTTQTHPGKYPRKAGNFQLTLAPTRDILASLKGKVPGKVIGFAATVEGQEEDPWEKYHAKGCDFLVVNRVDEVGSGFGSLTNRVTLLSKDGKEDWERMSKEAIASKLLKVVTNG